MLAVFIIIKTPHGVKSKQHYLISEMTEVKFGHIFKYSSKATELTRGEAGV